MLKRRENPCRFIKEGLKYVQSLVSAVHAPSGLTGEWLRLLSQRVWRINQNAKLCLMELPVYPVPFSVVRIAFFLKQKLRQSDFAALSPFFYENNLFELLKFTVIFDQMSSEEIT